MNNLLLFFALPVATIILSIVVQKILRNELLTTATFFAIYLIVTFAAFDVNFLIYAIAYTILAYITALFTELILKRLEDNIENNVSECMCSNNRNIENNLINQNCINDFDIMNDFNRKKSNEINNRNARNYCFRR